MKKKLLTGIAIVLMLDAAFIVALNVFETSEDYSQEFAFNVSSVGPFSDVMEVYPVEVIRDIDTSLVVQDDQSDQLRDTSEPRDNETLREQQATNGRTARRSIRRVPKQVEPLFGNTVITYKTFDPIKFQTQNAKDPDNVVRRSEIAQVESRRSESTAVAGKKKASPVLKVVKKPYDWLKGVASLFN